MPIHVQKADTMALLNWVPPDVQNYLLHTETGLAIRYLARQKGCHASTDMRQIRRLEHLRDDPLVDAALRKLGKQYFCRSSISFNKEPKAMTISPVRPPETQDDRTLNAHAFGSCRSCARPARFWRSPTEWKRRLSCGICRMAAAQKRPCLTPHLTKLLR